MVELYTRITPTSVVAFIDLKSAFDVANILDQLVDFGVMGNVYSGGRCASTCVIEPPVFYSRVRVVRLRSLSLVLHKVAFSALSSLMF